MVLTTYINYITFINYTNYITDGCSSDEEDNILKSNLLQHKINRTTSTIEITKLRKIPTVLFYVFLLIFSLISLKYAAGFYRVNKYKIYRDKFSINYFSEAFAEQFVIIKVSYSLLIY